MRTLIEEKAYSNHPGDKYLIVVLCKVDWGVHPYVTWVRNKQTGGDAWGHYHETLADAVKDFNERGR